MTIKTPRMYGYGLSRTKEDQACCIEHVFGARCTSHQCVRKRGHGPDGLYCKQHDPAAVTARRRASQERYNKQLAARVRPFDLAAKHDKALKEIAKHLSPHNENVRRGDLVAAIRDLARGLADGE